MCTKHIQEHSIIEKILNFKEKNSDKKTNKLFMNWEQFPVYIFKSKNALWGNMI